MEIRGKSGRTFRDRKISRMSRSRWIAGNGSDEAENSTSDGFEGRRQIYPKIGSKTVPRGLSSRSRIRNLRKVVTVSGPYVAYLLKSQDVMGDRNIIIRLMTNYEYTLFKYL